MIGALCIKSNDQPLHPQSCITFNHRLLQSCEDLPFADASLFFQDLKQGSSTWGFHLPSAICSAALNIEKIAHKYDMPTLAVLVVEELGRQIAAEDTYRSVDLRLVAELALRWKNKGVLGTCMEVAARPLEKSATFPCYGSDGYMKLPQDNTAVFLNNMDVVTTLVKAVNKAVAKRAGIPLHQIPKGFVA